MARPLRIIYPGAFYHVTSRGNERRDIYKSQRDRVKFLSYLESASERYGAVIHAFCLMTNHYHLILETPEGNLSEIMQHINGAYTTYFNVKRKRAGHLFQGRHKSILVEADEYATELSRYIHLNPVRAGIVTRPEDFVWSSYPSYIGKSLAPAWLKTDFILGYFGEKTGDGRKMYRAFVEDMIGKEYKSPLEATFASSILGSPDFVEEVATNHLKENEKDQNIPVIRQLFLRPTLKEIINAVRSVFSDDEKLIRLASIHVCHKYSGARLREVASMFKIGETAIIEASKRFSNRMDDDKKLREAFVKIRGVLKYE